MCTRLSRAAVVWTPFSRGDHTFPLVTRRSSSTSRIPARLPDTSHVPILHRRRRLDHHLLTRPEVRRGSSSLFSTLFSSSSRLLSTTGSSSRLLLWVEVLRGSNNLLIRAEDLHLSHRVCILLPIAFHTKYTLRCPSHDLCFLRQVTCSRLRQEVRGSK